MPGSWGFKQKGSIAQTETPYPDYRWLKRDTDFQTGTMIRTKSGIMSGMIQGKSSETVFFRKKQMRK